MTYVKNEIENFLETTRLIEQLKKEIIVTKKKIEIAMKEIEANDTIEQYNINIDDSHPTYIG